MSVRKIIYLINPISGTQQKMKLTQQVAAATSAVGIAYEILPTVASGDYQFVAEKITEEGFTDVVICGGDGTVNHVVQQLLHLHIDFGIIPMGSGNGLALAAGIPTSVSAALATIIEGNSVYIDAFSINNQFACMLCGIGFDAKVAHDFSKQKTRGLATYTMESIKNFFTATPYAFTISCNQQHFSTEAFFISIANSNQFGNNFTIAPEASLNDGLLDVVVVQKMNKVILPMALLQQLNFGKPAAIQDHPQGSILYFQTESISILNPNNAPMHIDGEPVATDATVDIKILPRAFRLIQPI